MVKNGIYLVVKRLSALFRRITGNRRSEEDNKILKYIHGEKSMKAPFIIYVDLESLLEKMDTCYHNPKKS